MILYVKGADFSSANIGTLNTFAVRKSIGIGATYDIPDSVTKNTSVTWTITLADGYTFGSYSVTMGTTTITPSVSGNVMTITINSVTANITINVATVNESTGDEDPGVEPEGDTTLLVNNLTDLASLTTSQYGQTQGKNGSSFIERTNIESGKYIEYIDFYAITPSSKTLPTESVDIADLKIYFVDSSSDTVTELVFDQSNFSSQNVDGVQMFRCNINKYTTYTTNIGITVNAGYEDFSTLNTIPYVSFNANTSTLEKPYFGAVINLNTSYAGKTAAYYCPMRVYGK